MTATGPPVRRLADWPEDRLRALAADYETPLYVVDLERVRENYARVTAAFPDAAVHYAVKANATGAVLGTLASRGAGAECVSAGEVRRALDAGVPAERVLYTATNPPARDLDRVLDVDGPLTVTVDAADTLDRLAERGYDGRLCVRVNPGIGAGHHDHVKTGGHAKFGVPAERALAFAGEAVDRGFDVVGLHTHAGSGITGDDLAAHRAVVTRLGELARELERERGVALEFVDVGGGFGVPYRPTEPPIDLGAVATATREALGDVAARLVVEPGRYLVADAGVLLTRTNTVKRAGETTVVGIDAGMNDLLRPALYGAYHHVRSLAPDAPDRNERPVTIAGPICETADVLGEDRPLPDPRRGDLLAVGNAGAYGFEMASRYNSRPLAAVAALDGDRRAVVRRRETIPDLTSDEREVQPS